MSFPGYCIDALENKIQLKIVRKIERVTKAKNSSDGNDIVFRYLYNTTGSWSL